MSGRIVEPRTQPRLQQLLSQAWAQVIEESPGLNSYFGVGSDQIERSMVFRLCLRLQETASTLLADKPVFVDTELTRQAGGGQKLGNGKAPDIVVHCRDRLGPNLLVVECKPSSTWETPATREQDELKLIALTHVGPTDSDTPYEFGVRMRLRWDILDQTDFEWYSKGMRCP